MPPFGQSMNWELGNLFSEMTNLTQLLFGQLKDSIAVPIFVINFKEVSIIEYRKLVIIGYILQPCALVEVRAMMSRRELIQETSTPCCGRMVVYLGVTGHSADP